jgi:putative membrane protein
MTTILWLKAFHVFAVVSWFAGVFYLPRLFVYHAMCGPDEGPAVARLKVMERKLYRFMTGIALVAIVLGTLLIVEYVRLGGMTYLTKSAWLHAKLLLVAFLMGYHGYCGHLVKVFANDKNTRDHKWFRFFNEAPVFLLLGIVILVIVKPF